MAPEQGWTDSNPVRRVTRLKEPDGRTRFLSAEERRALVAAAKANDDPRLRVLVLLALAAGAREGELMRLRWADLDLTGRVIRVRKTKNGDPKACPVRGQAFDALAEWARACVRTVGGEHVFGEP
jgi:integrase